MSELVGCMYDNKLQRLVTEDEMQNPLDIQVDGDHYKQFKIQPIEFILANDLDYIQGNVIKYICRYKFKGGVKDLEKIKHYVDILISEQNKEQPMYEINPDTGERRRI
jgi:hypothetical protein